jgi:hypothetical protein
MSLEMSLLRAAIHPVNFYTSRMLSGEVIFMIADTLSGLGPIPCRETIYPSSFPEGTPNIYFSRFNLMLNFLRLSKVKDESFIFLSLYDHVVNICTSIAPELSVEALLYTLLVRCPCTFKSEGHYCITECTEPSNHPRSLVGYILSWIP